MINAKNVDIKYDSVKRKLVAPGKRQLMKNAVDSLPACTRKADDDDDK